jgi:hypothetical protein
VKNLLQIEKPDKKPVNGVPVTVEPHKMKNEMADAHLDITVRPGGNYTLSLESKKKQEATDAEKALAQK